MTDKREMALKSRREMYQRGFKAGQQSSYAEVEDLKQQLAEMKQQRDDTAGDFRAARVAATKYKGQLAELRARIRYRSAVSGLWDSNPDAVGTIDRINFDGVFFERI